MTYINGLAFRSALEDCLRAMSLDGSISLTRLRKMMAFNRYLARLTVAFPDQWLLKGGLPLSAKADTPRP